MQPDYMIKHIVLSASFYNIILFYLAILSNITFVKFIKIKLIKLRF